MDDNTRMMWHAVVGGGHLPGLNSLLTPWGVAFGQVCRILTLTLTLNLNLTLTLTLTVTLTLTLIGQACLRGQVDIPGIASASLASASELARFPEGGYVVKAKMRLTLTQTLTLTLIGEG